MALYEPESEQKRRPRELEDACAELIAVEREIAGTAEERLARADVELGRLKDEVVRLQVEVRELKEEKIEPFAKELASPWLAMRKPVRLPDSVLREDPVYGNFEIDPRLFPIYFHPLFQRLNYVRQLSFAYLTFPSASHTRLSHILGVTRNAKLALMTVFGKNRIYRRGRQGPDRIEISQEQRDRCCLKAELCALLHDVGHGPFGHALDKLMTYIAAKGRTEPPDKLFSAKYVAESLKEQIREIGFEVDEILDILDSDRRVDLAGWDVFIADVIDSQMDVDRMDYLTRDAHMTGLVMGNSNVQALMEHMCPFLEENGKVSLTFSESALPHLEHLLYAHHIMYINCYEHPRKLCAERFLIRLAEYAMERGVAKETLMLLTDEQLLSVLSRCIPANGAERECLRCIQENRNFFPVCKTPYALSKPVWNEMANKVEFRFNDELNPGIEGWYKSRPRAKQRRYVFGDAPKSWEGRICDEANLAPEERWMVVVTVPAFDAKQAQESGTSVLVSTASGYDTKQLFEASPVMRAVITDLVPAREVIHVLVSEDLPADSADRVANAADSVFKS